VKNAKAQKEYLESKLNFVVELYDDPVKLQLYFFRTMLTSLFYVTIALTVAIFSSSGLPMSVVTSITDMPPTVTVIFSLYLYFFPIALVWITIRRRRVLDYLWEYEEFKRDTEMEIAALDTVIRASQLPQGVSRTANDGSK
jgi:archaellum biogenesis protein FlaJ (TadC family)